MRILDIGVATAYALLCLSLVSYMGPYAVEHRSVQTREDALASSAIFGYVRTVGLPFLSGSATAICTSLEGSDNATLVFGGNIGGYGCPSPAPAEYLGSSSLNFTVSGRELIIEAWVIEGE